MPCKIIISTLAREHGETGVQTHFNAFKKYLLETGYEVSVVTPFSFYQWLVVPVFGVRKILNKLSGGLSIWWYRHWHYVFLKQALAAQAKNDSNAVFYAQCPLAAKAALEVRRSSSQKVIMAAHLNGSQADEGADKGQIKRGGWLYKQIKRLENETLTSLDGIVYVSKFMKKTIESNIPEIAKVRAVVLPNFITKPSQLNSVKFAGDLISIGKLEPRKNQSYLLHVLLEAKKLGKRYSLTLVGNDGSDLRKLKALAQEMGIHEQVKFTGFQKDAAQLLFNHHIYVHSALVENLPIVIIEAMACGLPILAGAVGGIPEVLSDGVEGVYWPLDNPTIGAKKLIALMEEVETRNTMSNNAQKHFYSNFESGVVAKKLFSFICGES